MWSPDKAGALLEANMFFFCNKPEVLSMITAKPRVLVWTRQICRVWKLRVYIYTHIYKYIDMIFINMIYIYILYILYLNINVYIYLYISIHTPLLSITGKRSRRQRHSVLVRGERPWDPAWHGPKRQLWRLGRRRFRWDFLQHGAP